MNAYALAFVASFSVLLGGTAIGYLVLFVGDLQSRRRLVLTHAIACAVGFCAAVAGFYLRA